MRPNGKTDVARADGDYAFRTRDDGLPVDPWLRVHVRAGGRIDRVAPRSMGIPGTVEEWREWTGLPFDTTGPVVRAGSAGAGDVRRRARHRDLRRAQRLGPAPHGRLSARGTQAPATALRTSLTQSARNASAQSTISTLEWSLLRHSAGVRSVLSSHSSVTARNGMKNAPSTP